MGPSSYVYPVVLAILCNVGANIALKAVVSRQEWSLDSGLVWWLVLLVPCCIGLLFFYAMALRGLNVNIVYGVVTSGALVLLSLITWFTDTSALSPTNALGVAFIVAGIALVSL